MNNPAFTHLCPGCFAEKGNASTCPHCGYDESQKRGPLVLPHRTLLNNGQYLIGKVLGKPGGFGITYLAFDTKLETKVAIKEYLPRDLAGRDGDHVTISAHSAADAEHFRYGLTQFLQEARTLARFDHANIVRVRNFFEENGTGYLVMDYYDGITLADYLAQQPQGKLPEQTAIDILMPILDGLREVHAKNFLHRDIKPQNIYLTTGNRAILLDFGAARQAMSERSRSLSVVLSEGYAPYEQYHRRGEQGPWTDIYASAAVLYHAVAGQPPPPATERVAKDELDIGALGLSASLANALRLGLAVDHKNRPQTMAEFQSLLTPGSSLSAITVDIPKPKRVELSAPVHSMADPTIETLVHKKSLTRRPWFVIAFLILLFVIIVLVNIKKEERANEITRTDASISSNQEQQTHTLLPDTKRVFFDLFDIITTLNSVRIDSNREAEFWFSKRFTDQSENSYVAFVSVYTLDEKYQRVNCHACAPSIAAVTYKFRRNKWEIVGNQMDISRFGSWGETPNADENELIELLKDNQTFTFDLESSGQGYSVGFKALFDFDQQNRWQFLGSIDVSESNSGRCDDTQEPSEESGLQRCWSYTGKLSFNTSLNNKYPEIIVLKTGTQADESFGKVIKAKNTKYIFDGKVYKKYLTEATQQSDQATNNLMPTSERYSNVNGYPITDCVKDTATVLTWEGKPVSGERASSKAYTNYGDRRSGDASAYVDSVNAIRLCGYSDWRLPAKDELLSLVEIESKPTIDNTWLPNTQADWYWSVSPYASDAASAWVVGFGYGGG